MSLDSIYQTRGDITNPTLKSVMAKLSTFNPEQLKAFANQHQDDMILLGAAQAVHANHEKFAQAKMAQQGGQMPPVNQQVVQGMGPTPQMPPQGMPPQGMPPQGMPPQGGGQLPEQQGIAQLPTPNIQNMAGGGIVAFADGGYTDDELEASNTPVLRMAGGGEIKKYSGQGESLVRTTNGGKSWWLDVPKTVRDPSVAWYREIPNPLASLADKEFSSREEALQAYNSLAQPAASASSPLIIPYGQSKALNVLGDKPPAPAAPPPPPAPTTQQGLGSIPIPKTLTAEQAKEQAGQFADFSEPRTALKQAELDQETQGARMRTTLSEGLPKEPLMQGLEKLLDKQEAETGGEKEKAAGLALLTAGLAIAGGSSPFALQNLKEAIPAVTQYGDALKDIKKMQRENMKLRGDIEVARRAEATNNLKLKLDVEDKIAGRKDKLNDMGINLLAKIADTDTRTATSLWTASQDNSSRIQATVAGARASNMGNIDFLERLGGADPNSALRKGYSLSKQEASEPKLYSEYIKLTEDPINGAAFKQKYPTFEIYKEGYSGSGLQFAAPPANASILKAPKG